jgi:hypothetical protein
VEIQIFPSTCYKIKKRRQKKLYKKQMINRFNEEIELLYSEIKSFRTSKSFNNLITEIFEQIYYREINDFLSLAEQLKNRINYISTMREKVLSSKMVCLHYNIKNSQLEENEKLENSENTKNFTNNKD